MFEIEQKYHVHDRQALTERLAEEAAIWVSEQENEDTYYSHPCRDFAQTGEALRIRRVDGVPMVTYKGKKLPGDVKAREELEWRLDPGDEFGLSMQRMLNLLGFRPVATVIKRRNTYRIGTDDDYLTVTIDEVPALALAGNPGQYAEIERVLPSDALRDDEIQQARKRVTELAEKLGLTTPESRSYLRMVLET